MTFWQRIKIGFTSIGDFLAPFIRIFLSSVGPVLASAALKAVTVSASYLQDNDEQKRRRAFDSIVADLKTQGLQVGIDFGTSMVNAAIEAALQKLKEGK